MKLLIVGDPHVRVDDIVDCENLLSGILKTCLDRAVKTVLFLGDLFHNHSIVHLAVLNFWQKWFKKFKEADIHVIALKGNHDFGLSNPNHHALEPFKDLATIVDAPLTTYTPQLDKKITYLPYYGPKRMEEFYEAAKDPVDILFCHETFNGAKYDNGFFAPDGMDQNKVNAKLIISGHIHTTARLKTEKNTVWYPGSPRWLTASDANKDKNIYLLDTDFEYSTWTSWPTSQWCQKIESREITSLEDISQLNKDFNHHGFKNTTLTLTLKGNKAQVAKYLEFVKGRGFLIKQAIEKEHVAVKESFGVKEAYVQFMKDKLSSMGFDNDSSTRLINRNSQWMT